MSPEFIVNWPSSEYTLWAKGHEDSMKPISKIALSIGLLLILALGMTAQDNSTPGILQGADLKAVVPTTYFFDGQVAPVQLRNSVAVRLHDRKLILAGLVDNSGYSSGVAAKYQGFFISERKIEIEGTTLAPGQYGFGFADGKFRIMDVGGNDVLTVNYHQDDELKRPVPLKMVEANGSYRLYAGKKYITINAR